MSIMLKVLKILCTLIERSILMLLLFLYFYFHTIMNETECCTCTVPILNIDIYEQQLEQTTYKMLYSTSTVGLVSGLSA